MTPPAGADLNPRANLYGDGPETILDEAFHIDESADEGAPSATKFAVAAKVITDADIRCTGKVALSNGTHKVCNKLLAKMASRPWQIQCQRCHTDCRSIA